MTTRFSRRAISCALLATTSLSAAPALAQSTPLPPPPQFETIDGNGVDLASGNLVLTAPKLSIGSSGSTLSYWRTFDGKQDSARGTIDSSGSTYTVTIGGSSENFTMSGSVYVPIAQDGATLTFNSTTQLWTYTMRDGTVAIFDKSLANYSNYANNGGLITSITKPTGEALTYSYVTQSWCQDTPSGCSAQYGRRLQSISSNLGYQLQLSYGADILDYSTLSLWWLVTKVTLSNPAIGNAAQSLTIAGSHGDPHEQNLFTDSAGRSTTTSSGGPITSIQLPGHAATDITIAYDSNSRVQSVINRGVTTTYAYSDDATNGWRTTTVTDALSHNWVYKFDLSDLQPLSRTDPLSRTVSIAYNSARQVQSVTSPEGNHTDYNYDTRGNITQVTHIAKPPSTLPNIIETAAYDASCGNPKTCNQPNSTTDARGYETDYSYDPTHGGVLSVTRPAPVSGAIRPQTRYSYSQITTGAGSSVWRLTGVSACQTGSSCTGTSDEVKSSISYNGNLLPISVTSGDGTGALAATASRAYDELGNVLTVDGPLPGSADTTRYRYDADREGVGMVDPDPDGAGALKERAMRVTYSPDG